MHEPRIERTDQIAFFGVFVLIPPRLSKDRAELGQHLVLGEAPETVIRGRSPVHDKVCRQLIDKRILRRAGTAFPQLQGPRDAARQQPVPVLFQKMARGCELLAGTPVGLRASDGFSRAASVSPTAHPVPASCRVGVQPMEITALEKGLRYASRRRGVPASENGRPVPSRRLRMRLRQSWIFVLVASAALAHYYFFYVRPAGELSPRARELIRVAVSTCVDAPLIAPIPKRFTVHTDHRGRMVAIDAAVFHGVVLYRVNVRLERGVLQGCSIDYGPGPYDQQATKMRHPADPNYYQAPSNSAKIPRPADTLVPF